MTLRKLGIKKVRYLAATNRSEISHTCTLSICVNNGHLPDENWSVRFNAYRRRRKASPPPATHHNYCSWSCRICVCIAPLPSWHRSRWRPSFNSHYPSMAFVLPFTAPTVSCGAGNGRRHLPAFRTDFSLHNVYYQYTLLVGHWSVNSSRW